MVSTVTHVLCRRVWFALIASFLALQMVSLKALANNEYQCQALFVFSKPITDLVEFRSNTEIATNDIKLTDEMFKLLVEDNHIFFSLAFGKAMFHVADGQNIGDIVRNDIQARAFSEQVWVRLIQQFGDPEVNKKHDLGLTDDEASEFFRVLNELNDDSDKRKIAINLVTQIVKAGYLKNVLANKVMITSNEYFNKFMAPYRDDKKKLPMAAGEVAVLAGLGFAAYNIAFWAAGITPVEVGFFAQLGRTIATFMPQEALLMIVPTALSVLSRFGVTSLGKRLGKVGLAFHKASMKRRLRRQLKDFEQNKGAIDVLSSEYLVRIGVAENRVQHSLGGFVDFEVSSRMSREDVSKALAEASNFLAQFNHYFESVVFPIEMANLSLDIASLDKKLGELRKRSKIADVKRTLSQANLILNEKVNLFVEGSSDKPGVLTSLNQLEAVIDLYIAVSLEKERELEKVLAENFSDIQGSTLDALEQIRLRMEAFRGNLDSRRSSISTIVDFARDLTLRLSLASSGDEAALDSLDALKKDMKALSENIQRVNDDKELTDGFKDKTEGSSQD